MGKAFDEEQELDSPPASYLCWKKQVGKGINWHTGYQEVSKCCTRYEPEKYIAHMGKKARGWIHPGLETLADVI